MKKFLGLIVILALVSISVAAQNSDPIEVNISATVLSGCNLTIFPTTASWADIPVPASRDEASTYIAQNSAPMQIEFGARLQDGNAQGELTLTTTSFMLDGVDYPTISDRVKFEFAAGIASPFPFTSVIAPPVGGSPVSVYQSGQRGFMRDTMLTIYILNAMGWEPGFYEGIFTLQVMETVI